MDFDVVLSLMLEIQVKALDQENIQKLMRDPEVKFDLVISEWLSNEMCNMSKIPLIIFTSLMMTVTCEAYKILVVFPLPGKSHSILGYGIVKHLLDAGHEVTYITPFIEKNEDKRLNQIGISLMKDSKMEKMLSLTYLLENNITMDFELVLSIMQIVHTKTLEHESTQKLMTDPEVKFDLVIAEWLSCELGAVYAAVFDAPLIWASTTEPHSIILRLIDENLHPAYNVGIISGHTNPLTFLQRVEELLLEIYFMYYSKMYTDAWQIEVYNKIIVPIILKKGRKAPTFDEVRYNASMVLGNSHVSLGEATRLPQNYKPIAGYHIDNDVKPLPENLKQIMDNAHEGVIYFSMGSNLRSTDWPEDIKRGLLKLFGGLKQAVIWKFEEDFPNIPKNVHVLKWAPQSSILAHPNCKFFITHGGLLSTTEAVHFGVPIIGIPVFGDQFVNVKRAVNKGYAIEVKLSYNLAEDLKIAIDDVMSNPMYRNKVKELSLIYHDRPVRPGVELVHWVEHVAKTRGAPHLRSPALMVPWYQKLYLDLAVIILVTLFTVFKALKLLISFIFSNKTATHLSYKKKN